VEVVVVLWSPVATSVPDPTPSIFTPSASSNSSSSSSLGFRRELVVDVFNRRRSVGYCSDVHHTLTERTPS